MAGITFTEGSGLQDSIYGKSQAPIRAFLEKRAEAYEQEDVLKKLFSVQSSSNALDKFTGMTAMSGFEPTGEGGAFPEDSMQEGFAKVLEQMTWKDRFSLTKEMMNDTKLMDLRKQPGGFINGYHRTRQLFGAALYGAAISGNTAATFRGRQFDATGADGKTLFDKAHPSKVATKVTQSNKFSDAFSNDALMAMEEKMQDFRGDNNELLAVTPDTIVIPNVWRLKRDVFAAIGADKDPATANNGFNYTFGNWTVVVWSYLNQFVTKGSAPWLLMDSQYNTDYDGAVWLDRQPLDVVSYIDNGTGNNVWRGDARFTAGFNDWRFVAGGGLTGGDTLISA